MHWRSGEAEVLAQPPDDEPHVPLVEHSGGEQSEGRRAVVSLSAEEDPRLFATTNRVRVCSRQTSEEGIELAGRDPRLPTCGSRLNGLLELVNVATFESRNVDPGSPRIGLHIPFDLALQVTPTLVVSP